MRDANQGTAGSAPAWMQIPGDPNAVTAVADRLDAWSTVFLDGARDLSRVEVQWTGSAATAFETEFELHPEAWKTAGAAFQQASTALDGYAKSLRAAKETVLQARTMYATGKHEDLVAALAAPPDALPTQTTNPLCQQAVVMFERAQQAVQQAGDAASSALTSAVETAPDATPWWQDAASGAQGAGSWARANLGLPVYNHVVVPAVNGAADLLAAGAHHPGDLGQMAGGALLGAAGATGLGASGMLDATVIGGVAGVPLGIASVGAIGVGSTLAAQGASSLSKHTLDEDMNVMQAKWANTKREGHSAGFKVTSSDGQLKFGGAVGSRPMTPEEKAMPFPQGMLAAHTESRIIRTWGEEFKAGDLVEIDGTEPPCTPCLRAMTDAAQRYGIKFIYRAYGEVWNIG